MGVFNQKLVHDPEKCSYCGLCAERCPHKALSVNKQKQKWRIRLICMKCGRCVRECPAGALQILKK